ncbi:MAG TPA: choice-of-anchor D domain-containing protein [Verrucomicrobiae bacterium]|nr:choice-of-anchor D domain-containing protein [Verrucomicrobiae bacterium]
MKFSTGRLCALIGVTSAIGLLLGGVQPYAWSANASTQKSKVLIYPSANETIEQLKQQGIDTVDNCGPYWLAEVSDQDLAKVEAMYGDRAEPQDDLNRIDLQTMTIDTTGGEPVVPPGLQQTETKGRRLRLIQFKGPVLPQWLEQVKRLKNVEVIHYVPNNAYLIYLDAAAEKQFDALREPNGPIQWIGAYHPYYKLGLALQHASGPIDVNVAAVNDPEGRAALKKVRAQAEVTAPAPLQILNQAVIKARVDAASLGAIARMPEVLWINRVIPIRLMDEVQALILASDTNRPTSDGKGIGAPLPPSSGGQHYLDFLTNAVGGGLASFTDPETYPIVDIADSGYTPSTTRSADFGSRVVYATYDFSCGPFDIQGPVTYTPVGFTNSVVCRAKLLHNGGADALAFAHGTAIASVIAGNNTSQQDPSGFNFGMGISPFGLIGSTRAFEPDIIVDDDSVCLYHVDDVFCTTDLGQLILQEYLSGARISNNSWDENLVVGENDGVYNARCQTYDVGVRDASQTGGTNNPTHQIPLNQELIMVFANGNDGNHGNPGGGGGGFGDITLTSPASAKNVISVGASESVRLDGSGCSDSFERTNSFDIAGYSSFGPTRDGRFKPEIVAPDTAIYAVGGSFWLNNGALPVPGSTVGFEGNGQAPYNVAVPNNAGYVCGSGRNFNIEIPTPNAIDTVKGTSFAAPAVSGGIQLLWWYFQHRLAMLQPSPAMAKAYLLNSARYLPITNDLTGTQDTLPSIAQGMGIMDLRRMFDGVPRVIRDESTPRALDTPLIATNPVVQQTYFTSTGQSFEWTGQVVSNNLPFRVTLAWTDVPGDPSIGDGSQLVNDLNLEVTIGSQVYRGNQFVGPNSVTGCPDPTRQPCPDNLNNVESVFLDPATPAVTSGAPWKVVVKAANIAGDGVPHVGTGMDQDFAIVIYNAKLDSTLSDLPTPGTNDTCQTAAVISNFPYSVVLSNFPGTTFHNVLPSPSAGTGGAEAFWKLLLPTAGTVVNVDTTGSSFNTVLSVWKGGCGALIEDGSNRSGSQSALTFTTDGTNDYYIVAEGLNNAGGTLKLNATATAAPVQFVPSSIDFGGVFVGATSSVATAVLTNGTSQSLSIDSTSLGGTDSGDFLLTEESCAGNILAPGGSCDVSIQFTPTSVGSRTAEMSASDNAVGSPQVLHLTGTGLAPAPLVCLSANALSFTAGVGATSAVQSVTITNCGLETLNISGVGIAGPDAGLFQVAANGCSSVSVGDTCAIGVKFAPVDSLLRSATLVITNDTGSPALVSLSGRGNVSQPDAAIGKNTKFKKMTGLNVFDPIGTSERSVQRIHPGERRRFYIAVKNAGSTADQFKIDATAGGGGFTVQYFLGARPGFSTEVSDAATNATPTLATATLAAGAYTGDATMMRVVIKADKRVGKGIVGTFTVRFTSANDPTKIDAVQAVVLTN